MKGLFGIAFLNRDEVADCFVEDFMSVCSDDKIVVEFADYLTNYYMTDESMFPPILWSQVPSDSKRTNNGPELFHVYYNECNFAAVTQQYTYLLTILLSFKLQRTLR